MRRKGSINDWHELLPVMNAYHKGTISFAQFAELGRMWLNGSDADYLRARLPLSEVSRVATYVKQNPGTYVKEIAEALEMTQTRVAELLGRLRDGREVKTTKQGARVRVWPHESAE